MTASAWKDGIAKKLLKPPPLKITCSHAPSGSFTVFPGSTCVAPTAVTNGHVTGKPGLKRVPLADSWPIPYKISYNYVAKDTNDLTLTTCVYANTSTTGDTIVYKEDPVSEYSKLECGKSLPPELYKTVIPSIPSLPYSLH